MRIIFEPRPTVLDPIAVMGLDSAAYALARRLLEFDDDALREFRGAVGPRLFVALGQTANLPWAEGVIYLGREPEAPQLLVPTMLRPTLAREALERAVARRAAPLPGPWALLHSPRLIFSVANAALIDRAKLVKWLDKEL